MLRNLVLIKSMRLNIYTWSKDVSAQVLYDNLKFVLPNLDKHQSRDQLSVKSCFESRWATTTERDTNMFNQIKQISL